MYQMGLETNSNILGQKHAVLVSVIGLACER